MRVVQAGLGVWGRSWTGVVRQAPGVELTAVVDPDRSALGHVDAIPGYASLEDALAEVGCDAVLVASPPRSHHAVAKTALEAGKHVLCEKPLATGLGEAFDLVRTAERAECYALVSQNYRHNAPFRAVQRVVREGRIGDLVSIYIGCLRDTRGLFEPDDFRYSMRHPYVLDMAIHHFDLIRAATGREVRGVFARSRRVPDTPFVHDPAVAAVLDLDGGVPVVYEGDWATRGPETSWNGQWEIVGEEGRLLWRGDTEDRGEGEVLLERWGEETLSVGQVNQTFSERAATLQMLREAVEEGRPPETTATDNVKSLAVVLGCVRSIESGERVDVPALLAAGAANL
ncbi:MAG TPA: Gfo/Idh/MocA family oxidoreductase [Rubrobacter sp.]|nr:Gfo/Idh/MocA family oxidoreductase [Rubrobacter sp.]